MPVHDDLGTRMKEFYEQVPKTRLMRRVPVALRLDGKAFHTFTRGFEKPFDDILIEAMQRTMQYLCENIQGCVLGYTQSDEITLILIDYQTLDTDAWFGYEVQKMCSIAASIATLAFNKSFEAVLHESYDVGNPFRSPQEKELIQTYCNAVNKGAMFDCRCFNIPKEEVCNLIYWRQLDASRNSVQMVGQAYFSHAELQHKSCSNIQDMLMEKYNINWNDFPTHQKRGSCCIKKSAAAGSEDPKDRPHWEIDLEIPQFKGEGRKYIEDLIYIGE